jgi:hypothetical protein
MGCLEKNLQFGQLLLSFGDDHKLCYNKKLITKKHTLQFNTFDNIVLFIAYI